MNYALILAGGIGQRIASHGLPKQFVYVKEKPIIIHTIDKFVACEEVQTIVVVCVRDYLEYMKDLLSRYGYNNNQIFVIAGGTDRQASIQRGVTWIKENGGMPDDLVIIHDGVRPLVTLKTIEKNISLAIQKKCAITVRHVTETIVVTETDNVKFDGFHKRDDSYCLTSPQTFCLSLLVSIYEHKDQVAPPIPLLDPALLFTYLGGEMPIVKEDNNNLKITNAEDYYLLKALMEFENDKRAFGLL